MKAIGGKSTKSDQELFENMNLNNPEICHQRQAVAQARTMDCSMFQGKKLTDRQVAAGSLLQHGRGSHGAPSQDFA